MVLVSSWLKVIGVIVIFMMLSLAILWFVTTQPLLSRTPVVESDIVVDAQALQDYVYHLSNELPPRSDDIANLDVAAAYIFDELSRFSDNVNDQTFVIDGLTYRNVIAHFGQKSDQCGSYIIGAHYDVLGGHPGADDNASGVAGLLELARLFAKADLPCPIELVSYTLEETVGHGHKGSLYHARDLAERDIKVEFMMSLEMIGYFSNEPNSQDYPLPVLNTIYPTVGNFIAVVGDFKQIALTRFIKASFRSSSSVPVRSINTSKKVPGITWSDHASYWQFGFPAVMITDTSYNRNHNYHTKYDTWDTLDYATMSKVVAGVYHATLSHMMDEAL
ncbi:MAG: M28 family peptidase [Thiotrichales bacterium]|nr:M28 family peptidase [Thiotrichales bacterium]